jgi:hypothetical protein
MVAAIAAVMAAFEVWALWSVMAAFGVWALWSVDHNRMMARCQRAERAAATATAGDYGSMVCGPNIVPISRLWINGGKFWVEAMFADPIPCTDMYRVLGVDGVLIWESGNVLVMPGGPAVHLTASLAIEWVRPGGIIPD